MEMNKGKVALICGGGQSLGEALSYRMAEAGYNIAGADINGEKAEKKAEHAAGQYGGKTLWG